jgi:chemotaxis protein methyltransferase WspC
VSPAAGHEAAAAVRRLLGEQAGIDPAAMGERLIEALIEGRLRRHGGDARAWLERLGADEAERQAVVEAALVHETWFFRDVTPFDHLAALARQHWRRRTAADPVRVLSAPCASGEEAWSIAATLLHAGLKPEAVAVTALDLSEAMVRTAERGVYGPRGLRNHHAHMVRALSAPLPDGGLRIGPELRRCVTFGRVNLLRLPDAAPFDAIFCRNALMYMHEAARGRVVARLRKALAPGAPLFVGHAEAAMLMRQGFAPSGPARAFALTPVAPPPTRAVSPPPRRPPPPPRSARTAPGLQTPRPLTPRPSAAEPAELFARARRLADAGALDEALAPLLAFLDAAPTSADGHALAGIVFAARGERAAALRHLRKALYLNPADEASRVHLEHLLEGRP